MTNNEEANREVKNTRINRDENIKKMTKMKSRKLKKERRKL